MRSAKAPADVAPEESAHAQETRDRAQARAEEAASRCAARWSRCSPTSRVTSRFSPIPASPGPTRRPPPTTAPRRPVRRPPQELTTAFRARPKDPPDENAPYAAEAVREVDRRLRRHLRRQPRRGRRPQCPGKEARHDDLSLWLTKGMGFGGAGGDWGQRVDQEYFTNALGRGEPASICTRSATPSAWTTSTTGPRRPTSAASS